MDRIMRKKTNSCYTYFAIKGNFDPEDISAHLQLTPSRSWKIGEKRRDGKNCYDFALWEYGRCDEYDLETEKQMLFTIKDLKSKIPILKVLKEKYHLTYVLEIVPELHVNETYPCLNPNREIIEFCYLTDTDIDIDLYLFN